MIKQSSETSHFIFTGIELSGTSTVIFWLIYKYIFGIPLKCRPTTSRLLFKGGSAWCGATPLLPSLPSPPSSVISPSRPALVGCVRFKFRDFKLPAACFLSWSPENNAAVNGGERVFTHYMRVKSAHLGVVLVLIGLFPPVAAPSVCSIFQCPPVLAVLTVVHLTSNLGFPHRWCLVSLTAVRALDSGSSSEKFRRSPMYRVSLSSSCCDKDAGGFFMVSFHKIGPRLTSGPCN